jgi:colanic acid biosynthesis glycosyl transferase WcaI
MRTLIIAQYYPPDMGGGATRAYNLAKGLLSASCSVTVVTAFPHYPAGRVPSSYRGKLIAVEYCGVLKVFRTFVPSLASEGLTKRILLFVSFVFSSLFALPFVGKIDVVLAANPNVIAFFPSLIYRIAKHCQIVQNVDDLWPESLYDLGMSRNSLIARVGELFAKTAYKLSSAITPISPAYVPTILEKYKVAPGKVHVVPAGIDLDRFRFTEKGNQRRDERRFMILYIGAFSPAYDFDQVFRAAQLLVPYPDIQFVIQGGGELAGVLKSKVQGMQVRNVTIVDKIVSREEVARRLTEADALLLPLKGIGSIEMGISSKLYEYQASGKPIICCSNGQPKRYISETGSGVVVRPGDHEGLARSVLYLRENPIIAARMGSSGKLFVERNLTTQIIGLRMKRIISVVKSQPAVN